MPQTQNSGQARLKIRTQGRMTMKTATTLATELAIGVMAPVVSQIDPMHVGEVSRAMKVAKEYGDRLSKDTKNLQSEALEKLINHYPSHSFVIDREEAKELFKTVRAPSDQERALIDEFGSTLVSKPLSDGITFAVSRPKSEVTNAGDQQKGAGADSIEPGAGDADAHGGSAPDSAATSNVTPIADAPSAATGGA